MASIYRSIVFLDTDLFVDLLYETIIWKTVILTTIIFLQTDLGNVTWKDCYIRFCGDSRVINDNLKFSGYSSKSKEDDFENDTEILTCKLSPNSLK